MSNPTRLVSQFDGSAAYTAQSGTGTWTVVAPERYDDGLWLEEGTTNYVLNPSGENSFALTIISVGATVSKVDDDDPNATGDNVIEVSATTDVTGVEIRATVTPGTNFAISFDCWLVSGAADWFVNIADDGFAPISEHNTFTATPTKQRFELAANAASFGSLSTMRIYIVRDSTAASVLRIDAVQVERKAYATSYADAALGDGYGGSAGAYTRAASSASVATTGIIAPASGSLVFRNTRKVDTGAEEIILECGAVGAATDAMRIGYDATDHPFMEWNSNGAGWERVTATATVAVDTEALLYFDWDGTTIRCSVNNGALDSDTRTAVEDDWGAGDLTLLANPGSVVYDGFATFDRPLADAERGYLAAAANWTMRTVMGGNPYTFFQLRPY